MINIEITGINNNYKVQTLSIRRGTTVSELAKDILDIDTKHLNVGVFGKLKELSYTLQDKDRVEFYEKIVANPKIKRKDRAESI
jgi:putative ubiquitin-RnfH superfamily antitoxin RatB of RatAB toxin-antitoxin module